MSATSRRECGHEHCHCEVPSRERYCSAYCANVAHQHEAPGACACGHRQCEQPARDTARPEEGETVTSLGHLSDGKPS